MQHENGTPLREWVRNNRPADELMWKHRFGEQIVFVQYELHPRFVPVSELRELMPVRVVGTHTSKSVKLPVYSIQVPDLQVRIRGNFHNWVVSIDSRHPVPDVFYDMFDRSAAVNPVYAEGFAEDWVFGPYATNNCQFTLCLPSNYPLYSFLDNMTSELGVRNMYTLKVST